MTCKVLLINPPVPDNKVWVREGRCQQWDIWGAPFPPFSLAMISTQLNRDGHVTGIIDSGPQKKSIEKVLAECQDFSPHVVILATTSPTIATDLGWFAEQLKKKCPHVLIAAIGIHVTALPTETLTKYLPLDCVISGEPEHTARYLVRAFDGDGDFGSVAGLIFRNKDGGVTVNPQRSFEPDIDSLGLPDWEKIDFRDYQMPIVKRPFSLISFSRGCPFSCRFCATHAYNGTKLRKRSIPSLLEEIEFNMSLGVRDFLFWTELMTLDHAYLDTFLDAVIAKRLSEKIAWVCNSRVDSMTEGLAKKMKRAGCWQIAFGFEFGDDKILELAQKGGKATREVARGAAKITARAGIAVDGHFIMGFPGETTESLQRTIDFACSLPLTFAHFYACVPFPGSRLYAEAVERGWFDTRNWDSLTQDSSSLKTDYLDSTTVDLFIRKAYRSFYMRPGTVRRIYEVPKSFKEFIELTRLGLRFARELRKK